LGAGKASSVSKALQNVSAVQGDDAVFTCEVTQASSTVKWAKEGKAIRKSQRYDISQEDKVMKLIIHNVSAQDSGEYSCEVVGGATTKLESQEAEEGAGVTLQCELSKPGVPVEWKKGTQVLKSGEKYQMKQKASVNELLINKVEPEDSGDYSCVCGDQKTTASLKIKGRKRIFK
uniref:Ig-like domain-containing protein n=1 Tax=Seriola lalandi dorsalis TaxID=1841481 RepID=A0A3B4XHU3_SERLL